MATKGTDVNIRFDVDSALAQRKVQNLESSIIRFVGAVAAGFALIRAVGFPIKQAADYQKALLDIAKTTGFVSGGTKGLSNDLDVLSQSLIETSQRLNVSAIDLARVAAIAGQLGLGDQGAAAVAAFTETAARFSAVLDVSVEEAANGIAKLSNVFGIALGDAERISAALNEVSNRSTATGQDLLNIINRIGNIGEIDLADALGLAATGKNLGLQVEVIGTSFVKVISNMQIRAGAFSKFMGVSTQEWSNKVQTDGLGSLYEVLAQLTKIGPSARAAFTKTNFGGGRIFSLVSKLTSGVAEGSSTLLKYRDIAEDAFNTGDSSLKEMSRVLTGLNAQTTILGNTFQNLAESVGVDFIPRLTLFIKSMQDVANDPSLVAFFKDLASAIGTVASGFASAIGSIVEASGGFDNLAGFLSVIVGIKITGWLVGATAGLLGLGSASRAAAAGIGNVAKAQSILSLSGIGQSLRAGGYALAAAAQSSFSLASENKKAQATLAETKEKTQAARVSSAARMGILDKELKHLQTNKASVLKEQRNIRRTTQAYYARLNQLGTQANTNAVAISEARSASAKASFVSQRTVIQAQTAAIATELAKQEALYKKNAAVAASTSAAVASKVTGFSSLFAGMGASLDLFGRKSKVVFRNVSRGFTSTAGASALLFRSLTALGAAFSSVFTFLTGPVGMIILTAGLIGQMTGLFDVTNLWNGALREEAKAARAAVVASEELIAKNNALIGSYAEILKKRKQVYDDTGVDTLAPFSGAQGQRNSGDAASSIIATNAKAATSASEALAASKLQVIEYSAMQVSLSEDIKKATEDELQAQKNVLQLKERIENVNSARGRDISTGQEAQIAGAEAVSKRSSKSLQDLIITLNAVKQVTAESASNVGVIQKGLDQYTSTLVGNLGSVATNLFDAIAPVVTLKAELEVLRQKAKETGDELTQLGDPGRAEAGSDTSTRIEEVQNALIVVRSQITTTQTALAKSTAAFKDEVQASSKVATELGETTKFSLTQVKGLSDTLLNIKGVDGFALLRDSIQSVKPALVAASAAAGNTEAKLRDMVAAIINRDLNTAKIDELTVSLTKQRAILEDTQQAIRGQATELDIYNSSIQEFGRSIDEALSDREVDNGLTDSIREANKLKLSYVNILKDSIATTRDEVAAGKLTAAQGKIRERSINSSIAYAEKQASITEDNIRRETLLTQITQARTSAAATLVQLNAAVAGNKPEEAAKLVAIYEDQADAVKALLKEAVGLTKLGTKGLQVPAFDAKEIQAGVTELKKGDAVLEGIKKKAKTSLIEKSIKGIDNQIKAIEESNASIADSLETMKDGTETLYLQAVVQAEQYKAVIASTAGEIEDFSAALDRQATAVQTVTEGSTQERLVAIREEITKIVEQVADKFPERLSRAIATIGAEAEAASSAAVVGTKVSQILDLTPTVESKTLADIMTSKAKPKQAELPVLLIPDATALEAALRGATITATSRTDGTSSPQAFASGGFVSGAGSKTSDSIAAWLSDGEYVVKADAVGKYGVGFLDMLNKGILGRNMMPKFASGGLVGGGASGSSRDVVDINLNIGGNAVRLSGERDQVRALSDAFSAVNRGA
jgi:TP901 family phage tail tape measure protein